MREKRPSQFVILGLVVVAFVLVVKTPAEGPPENGAEKPSEVLLPPEPLMMGAARKAVVASRPVLTTSKLVFLIRYEGQSKVVTATSAAALAEGSVVVCSEVFFFSFPEPQHRLTAVCGPP
jgi:hypothetical protein